MQSHFESSPTLISTSLLQPRTKDFSSINILISILPHNSDCYSLLHVHILFCLNYCDILPMGVPALTLLISVNSIHFAQLKCKYQGRQCPYLLVSMGGQEQSQSGHLAPSIKTTYYQKDRCLFFLCIKPTTYHRWPVALKVKLG